MKRPTTIARGLRAGMTCGALLLAAAAWLGCGDGTRPYSTDAACGEVAQAIAYSTFLCEGDSAKANALHDGFLSNYSCASVPGEPLPDPFTCAAAIQEAECATTEGFDDNWDAWLGLDASCTTIVGNPGTSSGDAAACARNLDVIRQALLSKSSSCWNLLQFSNVLAVPLTTGTVTCTPFDSADAATYEAARDRCVNIINNTCSRSPSIDEWTFGCSDALQRVRSNPAEVCGEVGEAIRFASLGCLDETQQNILVSNFINRATCTADLTNPSALLQHRECLAGLVQISACDANAGQRADFWLTQPQAARCASIVSLRPE